jgi:hypothetical protein
VSKPQGSNKSPESGLTQALDEIYLTNAFALSMLATKEATVRISKITVDEAKRLVHGKKLVSFIGHETTAKIMSMLLGEQVEVNRSMLKIKSGAMIVITLNKRLEEGTVINTIEDIEKIGYSLYYVILSGWD